MVIYILEPYLNDSHGYWVNGIQANSNAEIHVFSLPAKHWKWRMHASAITLAQLIFDYSEPDHIIVSDMSDLSVLKANLPQHWRRYSLSIYFHENQITFPWHEKDQDVSKNRNNHYGFINYTSALAADLVFFNSHFHKRSFIDALPEFLNQFPDHRNLKTIDRIKDKSYVSSIGIEAAAVHASKWVDDVPIILWNHRWEYDKNPETFFETLMKLSDEGLTFKLVVCGNHGKEYPEIFDQAKEALKDKILHWGYVDSSTNYIDLLHRAHIIPVTSIQDYFGISVLQAIAHEVYPLMPNRLVFPEHLNDSGVLYENDKELIKSLRNLISNWQEVKFGLQQDSTGYAKKINEKYRWKKICQKLEESINSL